MSASDIDERFANLEMKAAFQEDLIQQLDDAVISQQRQISELQTQVKMLRSEFKSLENQMPDSPEPPPPHY